MNLAQRYKELRRAAERAEDSIDSARTIATMRNAERRLMRIRAEIHEAEQQIAGGACGPQRKGNHDV